MKIILNTPAGYIANEGKFGYYVWPRHEGFYYCIVGPGPSLVREGRTSTKEEAMNNLASFS